MKHHLYVGKCSTVGIVSTVFIVDRPGQGLSRFLDDSLSYSIESFFSARQLLDTAVITRPCCLIIDFQLPDMDGISFIKKIKEHWDMPVIITGEQLSVEDVLHSLRLGAMDVCPKPVDPATVRALVAQALRQDAEITRFRTRIEEAKKTLARLTGRQRELLSLFASGLSRKEIAATLSISPRTVEHHREHISAQLGTDRLSDFVHLTLLAGGTRAICEVCPNAIQAAANRFRKSCGFEERCHNTPSAADTCSLVHQ